VLRIYDRIVHWNDPLHFEDFEAGDPKLEGKKLGLIKCLVVPPRGTDDIPVLPMRESGRLLFPLCRTCARENKTGRYDPDYFCRHFEEKDRAFVATIARPELLLALENGYTVRKLYRCYAFEKSFLFLFTLFELYRFDSEIFKNYIREFLKIKVESSGWPSLCRSEEFPDQLPDADDPALTEAQRSSVKLLKERRRRFIELHRDIYGIELDEANIKRNDGLRYVAKLCLNSLCKPLLFPK